MKIIEVVTEKLGRFLVLETIRKTSTESWRAFVEMYKRQVEHLNLFEAICREAEIELKEGEK